MDTSSGKETSKHQRIAALVLLAVKARLPDGSFGALGRRRQSSQSFVALDLKSLEALVRANAGRRLHASAVSSIDIERMRSDLQEHTGAVAFLTEWTKAANSALTIVLGEQNRLDWVNAVTKVFEKVIERERRIVLAQPGGNHGHAKGVHLLNLVFERRLKDVEHNDTVWALKSLATPQRAAGQLVDDLMRDIEGVIKAQQHLAQATTSRIAAAEGDEKQAVQAKSDQRLLIALHHAWSEVMLAPEAQEAVAKIGAQHANVADTAHHVCQVAGGTALGGVQRIA